MAESNSAISLSQISKIKQINHTENGQSLDTIMARPPKNFMLNIVFELNFDNDLYTLGPDTKKKKFH